MNLEVGMKQRLVRLITALLLLLAAMSLSACIDESKWRLKDQGGPPHLQDGMPDYGA